MIDGKKVLAVITARGGSKGVKRKNIKKLCGKPLITWTFSSAKKSMLIDRIIISSDDSEIIEIAKEFGIDVPFIRPGELSNDMAASIDVVLHAIESCKGFDILVLLQPTSPLRTAQDIDNAIVNMIEEKTDSCVSVCIPDKSPYWMYKMDNNNLISPLIETKNIFHNRQSLPDIYALNGAVYVAKIEFLIEQKTFISNKTSGYIMPKERSIDIDEELDFIIAESIANSKQF